MSKSMLNTRNTTSAAVLAGGILPLGSAVHGYGCGIKLNGNVITVTEPGTYKVIANTSYAVTGTAAAVLNINLGDNVIASASETPAAAEDIVNLTAVGTIYISCKCLAPVSITLTNTVAGTQNELDVLVERM